MTFTATCMTGTDLEVTKMAEIRLVSSVVQVSGWVRVAHMLSSQDLRQDSASCLSTAHLPAESAAGLVNVWHRSLIKVVL